MFIQTMLDKFNYISKFNLACQELLHGRLISRIENRRRVWQTHLTGLAEVTP